MSILYHNILNIEHGSDSMKLKVQTASEPKSVKNAIKTRFGLSDDFVLLKDGKEVEITSSLRSGKYSIKGEGKCRKPRVVNGPDNQTSLVLPTGALFPQVGLGTWKATQGVVKQAVLTALDAGYRHIDCALIYGNEDEVGEAFAERFIPEDGSEPTELQTIKRADVFITSKLWNTGHHPDDVPIYMEKTLKDLGLKYLDLYLIHWPTTSARSTDISNLFPEDAEGNPLIDDTKLTVTWAAMEKLVDQGLAKHIGFSNFNKRQITEILGSCRIRPAVLQVESHPFLTQEPLFAFAHSQGLAITAYSPLGSPDRPWAQPGEPNILEDPKVLEIAKRYNKSTAQILIRYQVQRGVTVIPKSATPSRVVDNINVFDFSLSADDMALLNSFNRNWRSCVPLRKVNGKNVPRDGENPGYPFADEY